MTEMIHKWEDAGHGKAPFKVVGICEIPAPSLAEHNPSAYEKAMKSLPHGYRVGSCGVCGMGLSVNFLINSADGNKFAVGCECVKKAGDHGMIETVKLMKNKRNRQIAQEKREAAHQAKVQAERDRNGGLTDWEVEEQKRNEEKIEREQKMQPVYDITREIASLLRDGKGGFCDSIAADLDNGLIPSGRAYDLTCEIIAKKSGRKSSTKYWERYDQIEALLVEAYDIYMAI